MTFYKLLRFSKKTKPDELSEPPKLLDLPVCLLTNDDFLGKLTRKQMKLILSDDCLFESFMKAISPPPLSDTAVLLFQEGLSTKQIERYKNHLVYRENFFNDYPNLKPGCL